MAWHRARPDGGPTVHHTWSRPGETNPYAALDARIADARARRDECERKVAQLSGLSTQIGQLEEQKRRSASYLITAGVRRWLKVLTWAALPGASGHASPIALHRDDRARLDHDITRLHAQRASMKDSLDERRSARAELRVRLGAKADLVIERREEGWEEIARLRARQTDAQRRLDQRVAAVAAAQQLHRLALNTRHEWRRVTGMMSQHDVWVAWQAPAGGHTQVARLFRTAKEHQSRLAHQTTEHVAALDDLGVTSLVAWPSEDAYLTQGLIDQLGWMIHHVDRDITALKSTKPDLDELLGPVDAELERRLVRPF